MNIWPIPSAGKVQGIDIIVGHARPLREFIQSLFPWEFRCCKEQWFCKERGFTCAQVRIPESVKFYKVCMKELFNLHQAFRLSLVSALSASPLGFKEKVVGTKLSVDLRHVSVNSEEEFLYESRFHFASINTHAFLWLTSPTARSTSGSLDRVLMSSGGFQHANFARNEDEAEAERQTCSLLPPTSMDRGHASETCIQSKSDKTGGTADGPFSHHCGDNAPVWKLYMDQARISYDNLADILNSDLDPLLIFAGLFSAILSAFLIEIRKGLQEDLQVITNTLLTVLIENQHNVTGPTIPSFSRFEPSSSSRWVNGLWFSSLMFSLISALGASLAKGWVTQFSSAVSGSSWGGASVHCRRLRGLRRWRLNLMIQCLPILIHIALFLFCTGLVILVFQDDILIGAVILVLSGVTALSYVGSSIHSTYSSDSPFRTPLSGIIPHLREHRRRSREGLLGGVML
ncbi:hypothetical protein FB451DRAFT_1182277 [Mycena latifolia]|nr:hypothetical protein FB451DRAFT_1182277 [Mycena latifolia]